MRRCVSFRCMRRGEIIVIFCEMGLGLGLLGLSAGIGNVAVQLRR